MSRFGYIKDKFDERDYLMRAYLPVVKLPKKIDYTSKMSPVAISVMHPINQVILS